MSPDITDAAYQISPADSLTRPCNGKLQRAPNDAQTPVSDAHRIRQKRAYVDVHFHSLLAELDERESREPGWAYRNESTVGLVPVQEPRLERKRRVVRWAGAGGGDSRAPKTLSGRAWEWWHLPS